MSWISVKDDLPEIYDPVLIKTDKRDIVIAYTIKYIDDLPCWRSNDHISGIVTHWQPLPDY